MSEVHYEDHSSPIRTPQQLILVVVLAFLIPIVLIATLAYLLTSTLDPTTANPVQSEEAIASEGSFVLVGNGRLYGGRFPFFKQAVMNDGLLDVIVFKRLGYVDIIRYLQDVVFTPQISSPEVEYFQTKRVRVSSEESVPVEIDGELVGNCPVEFKIRAGGLRVLTPR